MHHLLHLEVDDSDRDLVSARLWTMGVVGVEDLGDRLRAAFTDRPTALAAAAALDRPPEVEEVDDHVGLDAWREFATWVEAGPFVICPSWIAPPEGALVITIDPGHAFGSGSHASTRLAVAAVAEIIEPGMRVLDVGCGSGVLSIAAALLGATVTAVDIDPAAVEATAANAAANSCADTITASLGNASDAVGTFDVVVVNVTIDIHDMIAADVVGRIEPDGTLIASGLLAGPQEQRLAENFPGHRLIRRFTEAEWAAITLRREGQRP